jgi:hypothetical protein
MNQGNSKGFTVVLHAGSNHMFGEAMAIQRYHWS